MRTPRFLLAALPLLSTTALAQSTVTPISVNPVTAAVSAGETSVSLDVGFGIRFVPPSRITVPAGEKLRINAPAVGSGFTHLWTRNGRAIPGATSSVLSIDSVTASDAGTYACQLSTPTTPALPSQQLVLGVGPTDRLLNLSARGFVGSAAGQEFITGFVVASGGSGKKIIVRAIGPSLSLFGVANPLRQPLLRIFDARGQPYENGYAYPAVIGGPTYESDLADSLARTGAFSVPSGTRDVVRLMPFVPGNYTVQVTSGDGTSGTALVEIYEVP